MNRHIYLDHNATTPLAPEAAEAMQPFWTTEFGNPSSNHWAGRAARDAVERARSEVAALLCCDATEIVFTSGGTEANNLALLGACWPRLKRHGAAHLITSVIEHPAVLEPCRWLEELGAQVTRVGVDADGLVDPDRIRAAIRPETALISIMHANNEVGTIQPIDEIAAIAAEKGIVFHTDAAQTIGKIALDLDPLGVDLCTLAGHKFYGPKGVGALFVREGVELSPMLRGAMQEAGRRPGTENVPAIVGLGVACRLARERRANDAVIELRDEFWQRLQTAFGDRVRLNGHPVRRLPNTLSVSFEGQSGEALLARMPHIAASTGSACHAGSLHASPVLLAMGKSGDMAQGTIRFSLGRSNTHAEIDDIVAALVRACDG